MRLHQGPFHRTQLCPVRFLLAYTSLAMLLSTRCLKCKPTFLSAFSLNFLLILRIKEMRCKCRLRWSVCWQCALKSHKELEASVYAQYCHLLLNTLHLRKDVNYFQSQCQLEQMRNCIWIQIQFELHGKKKKNKKKNAVYVTRPKDSFSFSVMCVRAIGKNLDNFL